MVIINSLNSFFQAQEELAWKIAKMIVSDVMQQAHCDQPLEKSTKVGWLLLWQPFVMVVVVVVLLFVWDRVLM